MSKVISTPSSLAYRQSFLLQFVPHKLDSVYVSFKMSAILFVILCLLIRIRHGLSLIVGLKLLYSG